MSAAAGPHRKLRRLPIDLLERRLQLPPAHSHILKDYPDPSDCLDQLLKLQLHPEALRLLAYALPDRESVWWSCMCAEATAPNNMPPAERTALDAAEAWVFRPDETAQLHARSTAEAAGLNTPGAWAALAASWSNRTPPSETKCAGRATERVIRLASTRNAYDLAAERRLRFIAAGRDIASGGDGRIARELES
jgi:hypothetical protein